MLQLAIWADRASANDSMEPARVQLAHGAIGGFAWAVHAERGGSNPKRPCISAESSGSGRKFRESYICGALDPIPALLAQSSGTGREERTVFVLAFPMRVTSVRLWMRGRASRVVEMKRLSAAQATRSGLARFKYFATAFAGPFCLVRFAAYSARGLVDRSPAFECRGG